MINSSRMETLRSSITTWVEVLVLALIIVLFVRLYNFICPVDQRLPDWWNGKWILPSGPRGAPIFGNLLSFAAKIQSPAAREKELVQLGVKGEMTTLHLGSRTWILLNSNRVCHEIIAKLGNATAERNRMPISSGIVSRDMRSLLMPTTKWTEPRRVMHHLLSGTALKQYGRWQEVESTQLLAEYLFYPEQWYSHHYRYANSVVHRIALGSRIEASGEDLANLQRLVAEFTGSIGSSVVDWFPSLELLPKPLQVWRAAWETVGQFHNDVYHQWWDPVREAIRNGIAPPSWARDVLLNPDSKYTGSDEEAMYCAMQLIEAGSDTTREALNIFVMAMIHYPQTLRRLREEIQSVCETNDSLRLPDLGDYDERRLPYVAAVIKEVLRWRPIFPLLPEHTLSRDLEFEGYRFPRGVSFVINGAAVTKDCDQPEAFRPERWIDGSGNEFDVAHGNWQFGGGRRICVGYRLAQRGLYLNIARLAMCYDFKVRGGETVDSHALNHHTTGEPFPVSVTLRDEKYRKLICDAADAVGTLQSARRKRSEAPEYTFQRRLQM